MCISRANYDLDAASTVEPGLSPAVQEHVLFRIRRPAICGRWLTGPVLSGQETLCERRVDYLADTISFADRNNLLLHVSSEHIVVRLARDKPVKIEPCLHLHGV